MQNKESKIINLLSQAVTNSGFNIIHTEDTKVIGINLDFEDTGCSISFIKMFVNDNNKVISVMSDLTYQTDVCDFKCDNCNYYNELEIQNINWNQ